MGDDSYNPFTAETHIKRVPLWQVLAAEALSIALVIAGAVAVVWWFAVLLFSLERIS